MPHDFHPLILSLAATATSIIFVATKHLSRQTRVLSRQNTSFVATKVFLSRQTYFCHDKRFVATSLLLSRHTRQKYFVATNIILSRLKFVAASILLSRQKTCFVATNTCFSRQNFRRDKNNTCGNSRQ